VSLNVAADRCAEVLRVLADDTRLHVVRLLLDGPRHVGQMNELIGIDQSLLSHHLRVMREAGLIVSSRDGKAVLYRLSPALEARRRGRLVDFGCCRLSFD
jgi:ArsR family transcriptional regulator, nickel/cobalt-responsive transcriptional repressor